MVAPLRGSEGSYAGVRAAACANSPSAPKSPGPCPLAALLSWISSLADLSICSVITRRAWPTIAAMIRFVTALAENTRELPRLLRATRDKGLQGVVLTGSVFEADEGTGETPLRAVLPYGVSKGLTAAVFSYWCSVLEIPLGKFVIPNPFGPFEEERFCAFLIRTWRSGKPADVRTPDYVRDNIHVDLLSIAYADFVDRARERGQFRYNPSLYVETQGAFADVGCRNGAAAWRACPIDFLKQTDFSEPKTRINTDKIGETAGRWSESGAWDAHAAFYMDPRSE